MYWVTRDKQGRWMHLHEGTRKDYRAVLATDALPIDSRMAHKLVRDDFPHSTALYVDEGKIRRARGGE